MGRRVARTTGDGPGTPLRDGPGRLPNVDSIVVVRHGALVYERYFSHPSQLHYDATTSHVGYSMTNSLVSLLVGIALDRGLIKDLDAGVFSFFPEYADLRTPEKVRITLRHLLTMSAGLNASVSGQMLGRDRDPFRHALEPSPVRDPGVSFEYSNVETELIGAILQRVSGKAVDVLAKENIFSPLASMTSIGGVSAMALRCAVQGSACAPATGRKSASLF
jgi:CubicO group peptidase (beta-lactamase class C family)